MTESSRSDPPRRDYDLLVVGAGLFGAVFAREAIDAGLRCLVVERRPHIGGNCFTSVTEGIVVHRYGPHIFHTNDRETWEYVNRFAEFNQFVNRPKVAFRGRLYSFPINLMTLYQLWGTRTPREAEARLARERVPCADPQNLEEWILDRVGREIYETFIEGYTTKQWGRSPRELPASIIKRLPIRLTFDDNYFTDRYQGIPIGGYTPIIEELLAGADVRLGVDYLQDRAALDALAETTLYTGAVDELFGYCDGLLEYRSLRFESELLDQPDYQGNAIVNHTDSSVPFTRIVEHKHFAFGAQPVTVITREYPEAWTPDKVPYYPVADDANRARHANYAQRARAASILLGGRLAEYRYYDMHQIIARARKKADEFLGRRR